MSQYLVAREPRPSVVLDDQLKIVFANPAFCAMGAWPDASALVGNAWHLADDDQPLREGVERCLRQGFAGPVHSQTIPIVSRTGAQLTVDVELLPFTYNERFQMLAIVRKIIDEPTRFPRFNPSSRYYEFEAAPGTNFWKLKLIWTSGNDLESHPNGPKCYQSIHGRSEPCEGCPILKLQVERQEGVTVIPSGGDRDASTFDIVHFKPMGPTTMGVHVTTISEDIVSKIASAKIDVLALRSGISQRERSVLDLLLLGRTMGDIAMVLQISVRTVKYHQRNIQQKLGADSRFDLARILL